MSKLGGFRKYIGISYTNQNVVFFSIGDLGKIIDLDLNCPRKAINWPRSSFGRVLSFECGSFWNFHYLAKYGGPNVKFGPIWAICVCQNLTFGPPYFPQKWKFQKLPNSNERTLPNDDLGQFIAFLGQFKSRSIIFPKSPIEKKVHFDLYRKSLYICETHLISTCSFYNEKIFF